MTSASLFAERWFLVLECIFLGKWASDWIAAGDVCSVTCGVELPRPNIHSCTHTNNKAQSAIMRARTTVAVVTSCLLAALTINLVVQISVNDRPLSCPYCAFQHKHNLQHKFYTPSFLYASALTRHANFHVFDEYSLTHFSHGVIEAAVCCLIAFMGCRCVRRPQRVLLLGFLGALIVETTWEYLENRPSSLKFYDFKNQQYCGDSSMSNSNFDILSMATGFGLVVLVASVWRRFLHHQEQWKRDHPIQKTWRHKIKHGLAHLPTWAVALLFAATVHCLSELYLFHTIKDGLLLSTVDFLWHVSGRPVPAALLWVEAQRTKLLIPPGARCHQLLAGA